MHCKVTPHFTKATSVIEADPNKPNAIRWSVDKESPGLESTATLHINKGKIIQ